MLRRLAILALTLAAVLAPTAAQAADTWTR